MFVCESVLRVRMSVCVCVCACARVCVYVCGVYVRVCSLKGKSCIDV